MERVKHFTQDWRVPGSEDAADVQREEVGFSERKSSDSSTYSS